MLSAIPLWALLTCVVVAFKGADPPEPFYWSTDCYTSDIHWLEKGPDNKEEIKHKPGTDSTYDWMLTKTVCDHSFYPDAHYINGRCVAANYDSPIHLPNFSSECANVAHSGFYQIGEDGLPDYGRKYYGVGVGHGYKYNT
ncbi:hypothetical protein P3342_011716 [Pyrenophora teres f. teres]|nr:hypothetical protein PTNB85_09809 [Pyrenophora teres f. teres]KAE8858646.1 hypothetical protein PTNB29_07861 [Pyrenophora teres f. teres]KAE8861513.1 hypothetical protein PTNB73_07067 [Pyrenophora teres f. teres]KAK1911114.1 hypothetical protein P3342_011716 [Pyrenophora teres f. teres]